MAILNSVSANSTQFNLANDQNLGSGGKKFTIVLQLSIAVFTISLVWFSFIYYPKAVDRFQNVGLPQSKIITAAAASDGFPIETSQFRIVYESEPNTYYVFIEGEDIAEFADNKNSASIAIKSALSLASICELNIIYVSTEDLTVPQDLKNPASCR
ncbi:hypothetical protein A3J17_03170 [Candidatus Curtissbacteria bacterium RIFCSPLOWO2_02_FULL_40_11]|uniref:Uncharacterized protein n=2 Tax=Candidatus Curtissiibacteriota TaxID=1752717 RepID=A0A1F5GB25_9BACT|nr:MAG: hypothetical protein A2775_01385 [Candidatus Curtissbacteria bacterium RIFCSPHIGHO2_01_FULL_39_57]OGD89068.1 MAG: hypothetical protein A3D04_00870 [Candidatus Curtissbacteria bacterium RIFCSPHIGHO2_02_FULL_40_16b]OGD99974.1 MAG: hypothetical protein A3J17_03170 [Candidatus Curtissbacteria bacterium RIFCSPLOWO2_02_FULL_40_11]OGE13717.1 MAG: hypothetical protein A3G14_03640 [Candidatus Curtissbacteria bacterium RIFCSPLOWO2_12_FULL_38_9]